MPGKPWPLVFLLALLPLMAMPRCPEVAAQDIPQLPSYTAEQRWTRSAQLLIAVNMANLMEKKAKGMTAEEVGMDDFRRFGPPQGWTASDTPAALFRGMYYNWMTHPSQACELIEATDTLVRARCTRPWVEFVNTRGPAYGVTLEEYETAGRVFCEKIAEYHSMQWIQEPSPMGLEITIRKR